MLDLSTAVLCDFAQVRDRLLFVSSGAVSRLYRQELPSPLGLMVGLVIEVPLEDAGMDHRLRAEVINRHGTVLATLENLFRVSDAGLFPHEVQQVPLVLSITGVRARTWGTHQVRLYLDDELVRALTLYVVPAAGPQSPARPAPTQSRAEDDEGSLGGTGTGPLAEGEQPAEPTPEPAPAGTLAFGEDEDEDDAEATQARLAPIGEEPPPPAREEVSWGTPSEPEPAAAPEPEPAFQPEPTPAPTDDDRPTWSAPTIAAEPAEDPAPAPLPDEATDAPEAPSEPQEGQGGGSRFAFRYRYEDDEG